MNKKYVGSVFYLFYQTTARTRSYDVDSFELNPQCEKQMLAL